MFECTRTGDFYSYQTLFQSPNSCQLYSFRARLLSHSVFRRQKPYSSVAPHVNYYEICASCWRRPWLSENAYLASCNRNVAILWTFCYWGRWPWNNKFCILSVGALKYIVTRFDKKWPTCTNRATWVKKFKFFLLKCFGRLFSEYMVVQISWDSKLLVAIFRSIQITYCSNRNGNFSHVFHTKCPIQYFLNKFCLKLDSDA